MPGSTDPADSRYAGTGSAPPTMPNNADVISSRSAARDLADGGRVRTSSASYSTPV